MRRTILAIILSIISLALVVIHSGLNPAGVKTETASTLDHPSANGNIYEYGIPVDSFETVKGTIRSNQTLGSLLFGFNAGEKAVGQLASIPREVFDLRKVKAGNAYEAFLTRDSSSKLVYLVYQQSPVDYYVFRFADTLRVWPYRKEVVAKRRLSEAVISTSLWETMYQLNLNPVLALDLSEVFAWTVDFFGIYKGDRFKVLYDELYVDSVSVGIGTIHAAWFEHRGERYYAYRFTQDSTASYWDENGNSLRKSFLKAPLRFSRISSRFSGRRLHPVLKIYRPHTGVDYAAPAGTPVMAIGDGVVIEKGYTGSAGNYVKIRHNSVYTTGYNHFSAFGRGIQKGVTVKQGQIIGYVGQTGYATGPHLDMRFWMNGKPVDPLKVKAPPVEPVRPENMEAFKTVVQTLQAKLDSLAPLPILPPIAREGTH